VSRLGVVVGYRAEARCLIGLDLRVVCSGAGSERARVAARHLVHEGVAGLVSFGLAGGLVADLASGDLLLPQAVVLPDGGRLTTDPAWRDRLAARLEPAGLRACGAPIVGSDHIVATRDAKRDLLAVSGAVAVDMESHGVAEVASGTGLPFLVVRAVADRSDQAIPLAAQGAIDAHGDVRHLALLGRLIRRPWELFPLIALGRGSSRGLARLRRVALLAPGLGFV
jgi:adenosylhomocysteine nucleosidase